jgi:hypothetical protein
MRSFRLWAVVLAVLVAAPAARADAPAPVDQQVLTARIDGFIAAHWQETGSVPAAPCDDATFLRRAYLDLTGKIPPSSEVRRFLRDPAPDKRQRLVEKLLDSPGYVVHMSNVWRNVLVPEADGNFLTRNFMTTFDRWLLKEFAENVPYDQMVREIVALPISTGMNRNGFNPYADGGTPTPQFFFRSKEVKPENLAASTTRIFLGVRLECAQCHDHPFAKWKKEQFWEQAAFFAGVAGRPGIEAFYGPMRELPDRRELPVPGTEKVAQATFLDGGQPEWKFKTSSRSTLADWMTSPNNPYFARTLANRLWGQLLGTGLVEPVDDFKDDNPPSHPELLDELARQFVAHQYDLKFMIRAITASQAYQLSSVTSHPSQDDPRRFARMAVKGLTPDQLYDSFVQATGFKDGTPFNLRFRSFNSPREDFLSKFQEHTRRTEAQTSIPQALTLMNNKLVADATNLERSETLAAIAETPFLDTAGRIEALYLTTLSRRPQPEEMARMVNYVDNGGAKKNPKRALADVMWALLNNAEFILNH